MSWVSDVSRYLGMIELERYIQRTTQRKSGQLVLNNEDTGITNFPKYDPSPSETSKQIYNITFNDVKSTPKKQKVELTFYDAKRSPLGNDFDTRKQALAYISTPCLTESDVISNSQEYTKDSNIIISPLSTFPLANVKSCELLPIQDVKSSKFSCDALSSCRNRSLSTSDLEKIGCNDIIDTPNIKREGKTDSILHSLSANTNSYRHLISTLSNKGLCFKSDYISRFDCSVHYTPPREEPISATAKKRVQPYRLFKNKSSKEVIVQSRYALVNRLCGFSATPELIPPPLPASDHPTTYQFKRKRCPLFKRALRTRLSDPRRETHASIDNSSRLPLSKSEHNLDIATSCPLLRQCADTDFLCSGWSWNTTDWRGWTKDMIHALPFNQGRVPVLCGTADIANESDTFLYPAETHHLYQTTAEESDSEDYRGIKVVRRTHSDTGRSQSRQMQANLGEDNRNLLYSQQYSTPHTIRIRAFHRLPHFARECEEDEPRRNSHGRLKRSQRSTYLRRSVSQPLDLDKSFENQVAKLKNLNNFNRSVERRPSVGNLLSDDNNTSEEDVNPSDDGRKDIKRFLEEEEDILVYAEALWDHVSLDSDELVFRAADLIAVVDSSDKDWWWGRISNRSGWFPKAFVRLLVNQEDHTDKLNSPYNGNKRQWCGHKLSISGLSPNQVRTNVVNEIICTEREYVKHLQDVVEGYLRQVRKRPDMFTTKCITTIFGNIEALYTFQSLFLLELEECIDYASPHKSEVGDCFIKNRSGFEIYSEYCNNHPSAVSELQDLYRDSKYVHFFEACRLLQEMIDISLDGFLLTPVQKICKYPLQLQELLKYTKPGHPDYSSVRGAMHSMKEVALLVNERKRRMECLEKIASWQMGVEGWQGADLLRDSSQLIHQGDVTKGLSGSWRPKEVSLFLFDHQLVYCKRDLLKRNIFVYRGRVNTDLCKVFDMNQAKEVLNKSSGPQHAFKVHCLDRHKTYIFGCKTASDKYNWIAAFNKERDLVSMDETSGFVVSEKQKVMAKLAARNQKNRPKRPKSLWFNFGGNRKGRFNTRPLRPEEQLV